MKILININILIFSLFLTGCLSPLPEEAKVYDTESIDRAFDKFEQEFFRPKYSYTTFSDEDYKGTVARCYQTSGKIEIVYDIWKDLQPNVREATIFHELVHCELGLNHFGNNIMSDFLGFQADGYVNRYESSIQEIKAHIL